MECLRQIMPSGNLSGVLELPQSFRDTAVEVIVMPAHYSVANTPKRRQMRGGRKLGTLEGKMTAVFANDFAMTDEELIRGRGDFTAEKKSRRKWVDEDYDSHMAEIIGDAKMRGERSGGRQDTVPVSYFSEDI